jgi:hypothetical protein
MIINLIFDQSGGAGFASFSAGVMSAASILEKAITDPITVTLEVGWGQFPTDHSPITGGAAEAEPNFALVSSGSLCCRRSQRRRRAWRSQLRRVDEHRDERWHIDHGIPRQYN